MSCCTTTSLLQKVQQSAEESTKRFHLFLPGEGHEVKRRRASTPAARQISAACPVQMVTALQRRRGEAATAGKKKSIKVALANLP